MSLHSLHYRGPGPRASPTERLSIVCGRSGEYSTSSGHKTLWSAGQRPGLTYSTYGITGLQAYSGTVTDLYAGPLQTSDSTTKRRMCASRPQAGSEPLRGCVEAVRSEKVQRKSRGSPEEVQSLRRVQSTAQKAAPDRSQKEEGEAVDRIDCRLLLRMRPGHTVFGDL
uniref:Uncharacterized protein n=1 Tax=Knipowitschia caucasica TaxID=637954 RepID=A0AAV2IYJ8_KNICA